MVPNSFGYFRHNVCKALECMDHQNKSIKRCQSKVIFLYESPLKHAACSSDEACFAKMLDVWNTVVLV